MPSISYKSILPTVSGAAVATSASWMIEYSRLTLLLGSGASGFKFGPASWAWLRLARTIPTLMLRLLTGATGLLLLASTGVIVVGAALAIRRSAQRRTKVSVIATAACLLAALGAQLTAAVPSINISGLLLERPDLSRHFDGLSPSATDNEYTDILCSHVDCSTSSTQFKPCAGTACETHRKRLVDKFWLCLLPALGLVVITLVGGAIAFDDNGARLERANEAVPMLALAAFGIVLASQVYGRTLDDLTFPQVAVACPNGNNTTGFRLIGDVDDFIFFDTDKFESWPAKGCDIRQLGEDDVLAYQAFAANKN